MIAQIFKHPARTAISILAPILMVLSACGPALPPATGQASSTPASVQEPAGETATPEATPAPGETLEYTNPDFGFTFQYPKGFILKQEYPHMVYLMAENVPQQHGQAWIEVERVLDQDAAWFANQAREDNASLGLRLTSAMIDIDGQQAFVIERVPGQDLIRQVLVVSNGLLYRMNFTPDDPAQAGAYQDMQDLFAAVTGSLRFMPEHRAVPPVTSIDNMAYQIERACETRSEASMSQLLGDQFVVGTWDARAPEPYVGERYPVEEAARMIIDQHLAERPDLVTQKPAGWTSLLGDPSLFATIFPDENITPVLVKGWGSQGSGEAVLIIAHNRDGSLYWRALYMAKEATAP